MDGDVSVFVCIDAKANTHDKAQAREMPLVLCKCDQGPGLVPMAGVESIVNGLLGINIGRNKKQPPNPWVSRNAF